MEPQMKANERRFRHHRKERKAQQRPLRPGMEKHYRDVEHGWHG